MVQSRTRRHGNGIFIVSTGVSGNLGDAVIRREVLDWVRDLGEVHAYVGNTTEGWIDEIGFRSEERVYRANERKRWFTRLLIGRGRRILVFDPGEVPLGWAHLRSEIIFLLVTVVLRLRGGIVIRPPRAVGSYTAPVLWLYRASCSLSQVSLLRTQAAKDLVRTGILTPDTAFHVSAGSSRERLADASRLRPHLLVSLRGARSVPNDGWVEGVREFAESAGLEIHCISQVDEDEVRGADLAGLLGAGVIFDAWNGRSDSQQEQFVRARYRDARMVISDRLHVLILAALAGAVPAEVVDAPRPKVADHFSLIGYHDVSLDASTATPEMVVSFLSSQLPRRAELTERLTAAYAELDLQVQRIRRLVSG